MDHSTDQGLHDSACWITMVTRSPLRHRAHHAVDVQHKVLETRVRADHLVKDDEVERARKDGERVAPAQNGARRSEKMVRRTTARHVSLAG